MLALQPWPFGMFNGSTSIRQASIAGPGERVGSDLVNVAAAAMLGFAMRASRVTGHAVQRNYLLYSEKSDRNTAVRSLEPNKRRRLLAVLASH